MEQPIENVLERTNAIAEGRCPNCQVHGNLLCIPIGKYDEEECYEFLFWCSNCRYLYRSDVAGYDTYVLELHPDGNTVIIGGSPEEACTIGLDAQEIYEFLIDSEDEHGRLNLDVATISKFFDGTIDSPDTAPRIWDGVIVDDEIAGDLDYGADLETVSIPLIQALVRANEDLDKVQSERADI